jgi:hypothetical protein
MGTETSLFRGKANLLQPVGNEVNGHADDEDVAAGSARPAAPLSSGLADIPALLLLREPTRVLLLP